MSCCSDDGETWSQPVLVGQRDNWLWRMTRHKRQGYGVGYSTDHAKNRLWVSYYSAHEANPKFTTGIYLAEVELD